MCVAAPEVFCGIAVSEYIVNCGLGDTVLECVCRALREGRERHCIEITTGDKLVEKYPLLVGLARTPLTTQGA